MLEGSVMRRVIAIGETKVDNDEIDLTPMLDVVFIMLIFFVVTASFIKEFGIPINAPNTEKEQTPTLSSILVAINENDEIWIDRRMTDPRAMRANIQRLHSENPDAPLVIQAHKISSNDMLVRVMDASRAAGVYDIALARQLASKFRKKRKSLFSDCPAWLLLMNSVTRSFVTSRIPHC